MNWSSLNWGLAVMHQRDILTRPLIFTYVIIARIIIIPDAAL
jgi:hypothetical protein